LPRFEIFAQADNLCKATKEGGFFWSNWRKGAVFSQRISGGNPAESGKGAKLPCRYVAEKLSPDPWIGKLKKNPLSFMKYMLSKALDYIEAGRIFRYYRP